MHGPTARRLPLPYLEIINPLQGFIGTEDQARNKPADMFKSFRTTKDLSKAFHSLGQDLRYPNNRQHGFTLLFLSHPSYLPLFSPFPNNLPSRVHHLPALQAVGFQANRGLLDVQTISLDCAVGEEAFRQVTQPQQVGGQRAAGLRFGDAVVWALLSALLLFRLWPRGFANRDLREHFAPLLGEAPTTITQGRITYQLRRLPLHGLIVRQPGTHRYAVTARDCASPCSSPGATPACSVPTCPS